MVIRWVLVLVPNYSAAGFDDPHTGHGSTCACSRPQTTQRPLIFLTPARSQKLGPVASRCQRDGDVQEWLLGYAEEPETVSALLRHQFPSKVGGRPAWLNPRDVPCAVDLTCPATGKQMLFLCQARPLRSRKRSQTLHRGSPCCPRNAHRHYTETALLTNQGCAESIEAGLLSAAQK